MNPRTEPLLWTQLLGLAVLPLESLLILLLLAGTTPGPVPLVEELLCWSLGALAPALLLWRAPADVWSLLLAKIPERGRRDLQQRLSQLQGTLPLKILGPASGSLALLPLVIRLDQRAAMAAPLWHSGSMPRLVALLLVALILGVMLWQWQQLVQALCLLGRSESTVDATPPMGLEDLKDQRLSLGLPLLLPAPLQFDKAGARTSIAKKGAQAEPPTGPSTINGPTLAIEPEQAPAEEKGPDLDEPIA